MSAQPPSIIFGQRAKSGSDDSGSNDLQEMVGKLLSILRYRRWLFAMPLLTGIMGVLLVSLFIPRQYVLRTLFERRDDPVLIKLVANSPFSFEMQRQALRYNIAGSAALSNAIDQAGMNPAAVSPGRVEASKQALINHLSTAVQVSVVNSTPNYDLIELRYTGDKPEAAEKLLPILRDNYIQKTQSAIRNVQDQAQQFFSQEVEKRRTQAARMQAELSQVLMDQPEVDPDRPEWLSERLLAENLALEQLSRQKHELVTEIKARQDYLGQLDEQQAQGKLPSQAVFSTKVVENPQRASLAAQIAQITTEIADAKTLRHMKDTHPYIESLNKKLAQLHIEFERAGQQIAGGVVSGSSEQASPWDSERKRIGMEMKTFEGKLEQIERDLASHQTAKSQLEGQKSTVFERQQTHALRRQELENLKADLNVWQSKLEEINRAMAAENVDRGVRFTTIEESRRPSTPANPKLTGQLMISVAVGLAIAALAVFLRELLDRSFRNPARVRQLLGIPVLETVEEIVVRPSPRLWLTRYVLPATAAVQTCAILVLGWLLYLSLERPEAYARWVQTLTARLGDVGIFLT